MGVSKNQKAIVDDLSAKINFETTGYTVELDTNAGPIRLNLWPDVAPGHCKNIIALAQSGYYDGLIFHRVIKGFMIQGGCPTGDGTGGPGYQIRAEFNNKPHEAGVLSMARTSDPHSAGSQFFICLGRTPHLDGQYTAFGKTADQESLDTVLKIGVTKTARQDRPVEDVVISKATVSQFPRP
jgi:cyclophilin family peptidyl-prolyl cis-trans isomerase